MNVLLAGVVASLAGYGVHALVGDHVSFFADFVISTVVSGVVYVPMFLWLKKLRD